VAPRVAKQPTDPGRADAGVHLDEIGPAGEEERHTGFAGDRACQQRLAGAGRPDQQHTTRDPAANCRKPARFLQEIDDFLDFVLGLVHARDVLEGDHVVATLRDAGPARHRRNPPGSRAVHREAEQCEERRGGAHRGPTQGSRLTRRLDLHAYAAVHHVGDEGRARAAELGWSDGLLNCPVIEHDPDRAIGEADLGYRARLELADEVGKRDNWRVGRSARQIKCCAEAGNEDAREDEDEGAGPAKVR
jgi:hypothetical protein